jgi:hypothetical protein
MTLTTEQYKKERPNLLESKQINTIEQIQKLQDLEKYMYENIENTKDNTKNVEVVNKINELSDMRINLFNSLKNMYENSQKELTRDRINLKDQVAVVGIIEQELNKTKKNVNNLKADKFNKLRLVQIGNYETQRYDSYIKIMKYLVYTSLALIALFFINNRFYGIIPPSVTGLVTIIIIATGIIMVGYQLYDIMRRDDLYFEKYNWGGSYNPDMTKDNSLSYQADIKNSSGLFSTGLNKLGNEINTKTVEGMRTFNTNPIQAQEGSIVPGVNTMNGSIESFSNYI